MPRPVALVFLIVAFAGPLLTHAEAAADLARVLIAPDGDLEQPDGGVGDDPNVAAVWRQAPAIDLGRIAFWEVPSLVRAVARPERDGRGRREDDLPWTLPGRSLAWLSVFLC